MGKGSVRGSLDNEAASCQDAKSRAGATHVVHSSSARYRNPGGGNLHLGLLIRIVQEQMPLLRGKEQQPSLLRSSQLDSRKNFLKKGPETVG